MRILKVFIVVWLLMEGGLQAYALAPAVASDPDFSKVSDAKLLKKARNYYADSKYDLSKKAFLELLKRDSTDVRYNFEMGVTYFESEVEPIKSIFYLERALRHIKSDVIVELYYYLGQAYHLSNRFEEATGAYQKFVLLFKTESQGNPTDNEGRDLVAEAERAIQMCQTAQMMVANPITVIEKNNRRYKSVIKPLPSPVNSIYPDYSSIITDNDSTLMFTSRRVGGVTKKLDYLDNKYYEDIWMSKRNKDGTWGAPQLVKGLNTKDHDACNNISRDGKKVFIYRDTKNGSLLVSEKTPTGWGKPKKVGNISNATSYETSSGVGITDDVIYIVSDRKGGFGGKDIYKAVRVSEGKYRLENLGENVNTPYDEDAPFLSEDENVLYFSSQGHNSIGGFDIFKSVKVNSLWSSPVSMGYPINSTGHDVFYNFEKNDEHYYFTSNRPETSLGGLDLFEISLECLSVPTVEIRGVVLAGNPAKPVKAKVTLTEKDSPEQKNSYECIAENGRFVLAPPPEKSYVLVVEPEGFKSQKVEITIPKQCDSYTNYQEIVIEPQYDGGNNLVSQKATIKNAFFDINKESNATGLSEDEKYKKYAEFVNTLDKSKTTLAYNEVVDVVEVPVIASTDKKDTTKTSGTAGSSETTPETVGTSETVSGTSPSASMAFNNLLFDFNQSSLNSESVAELNKVVAYAKENKTTTVELSGHTDNKGSDAYNLRLSKMRTNAAKNYLVSKGVAAKRIVTIQKGEQLPVAPNENPDGSDNEGGRKQNRRVEVKAISGK